MTWEFVETMFRKIIKINDLLLFEFEQIKNNFTVRL